MLVKKPVTSLVLQATQHLKYFGMEISHKNIMALEKQVSFSLALRVNQTNSDVGE
jgi:hypothetical protein